MAIGNLREVVSCEYLLYKGPHCDRWYLWRGLTLHGNFCMTLCYACYVMRILLFQGTRISFDGTCTGVAMESHGLGTSLLECIKRT